MTKGNGNPVPHHFGFQSMAWGILRKRNMTKKSSRHTTGACRLDVKMVSLVQPHHVTEQSLLIQSQHILGLEEVRNPIVDLLGG